MARHSTGHGRTTTTKADRLPAQNGARQKGCLHILDQKAVTPSGRRLLCPVYVDTAWTFTEADQSKPRPTIRRYGGSGKLSGCIGLSYAPVRRHILAALPRRGPSKRDIRQQDVVILDPGRTRTPIRGEFRYLRKFPFDKIKIDQSFIRDLQADRQASLAIVKAVATMSTSLRIDITAEGVETVDQLETLKLQGCTEVQGYLISKPRPASELLSILEGFAGVNLAA